MSIQLDTWAWVTSGWNCTPRWRPTVNACTPTSSRASTRGIGRWVEAVVVPLHPRAVEHDPVEVGVQRMPAHLVGVGTHDAASERGRQRLSTEADAEDGYISGVGPTQEVELVTDPGADPRRVVDRVGGAHRHDQVVVGRLTEVGPTGGVADLAS